MAKIGCLAHRHFSMVAVRLANPSFTLSHDRVVCPTWACLQVATHGRLYTRHSSVHNLNTSPKVTPCTLARWAGAHPNHPRTRAKSSHKLGAHQRFATHSMHTFLQPVVTLPTPFSQNQDMHFTFVQPCPIMGASPNCAFLLCCVHPLFCALSFT